MPNIEAIPDVKIRNTSGVLYMLSSVGSVLKQIGIGLSVYKNAKRVYTNECGIDLQLLPELDGEKIEIYNNTPYLFSKLELENDDCIYFISIDLTKLMAITDLMDDSGSLFIKADSKGNLLSDCIHPEDEEGFKQAVLKAIEERRMIALPRIRFKVEPDWRWFEVTLQGRETPFSPEIIGVARDITPLIDRSKKVIQLQGLLDSVFSSSPAQIYAIDKTGLIYLWEGITLFLDKGVLNNNYEEVLRDWPNIVEAIKKSLNGEETEWAIVYKGRHLESRVNPCKLEGEVIGVIGVITDRTDLIIKAEELKQFAYIASHDLKEPLRMVNCYAQLLLKHCEGLLNDKASKYAATIIDGCERMRHLIDDLLSYSKVDAHKEPSKVCLKQATKRVLHNLKAQIGEANAKITYPDETLYVWADELHIDQLLQNLISNAIKFSSKPIVHINWKLLGKEIEISIKDNGIGIEKEYADYIFQPFKRLNRNYPGTGIGLSICKKVVEANRGQIRIESEVGVGTEVYILLPEGGD